MSSLNDNSPVIEGGTDGTPIGNVGDRMKVDAVFNAVSSQQIAFSSKFRADYSNTVVNITGGTYTDFYSYTGTGYFWGFRLLQDQDGGQIRLTIDGDVIFSDITSKNISELGFASNSVFPMHSRGGSGSYHFIFPFPIKYNSSVELAAKRDSGGALKVQDRIIYISKET